MVSACSHRRNVTGKWELGNQVVGPFWILSKLPVDLYCRAAPEAQVRGAVLGEGDISLTRVPTFTHH